jgi:hypothetical protein
MQVIAGKHAVAAGEPLGKPEKAQLHWGQRVVSGSEMGMSRLDGGRLAREGRRGCRGRVSRIPGWLSQPQGR